VIANLLALAILVLFTFLAVPVGIVLGLRWRRKP
jgi:hypothetical protein